MVNYEDLPLFPLHVVLFPDMPLPLHIFEPRYREMIRRCREENSPFGVVLIRAGSETGESAVPHGVGTTARLTHYEELADGRMNIVVLGETRFRVIETRNDRPYLCARVEPFWEQTADPILLQAPFDTVSALFRTYLKALYRPLSALQLPQEPEFLSYGIARILQVPLTEKQRLLELTATEERLRREIDLLESEIEAHQAWTALQAAVEGEGGSETLPGTVPVPVDTGALGKLASKN